jgi:hypothetical protein
MKILNSNSVQWNHDRAVGTAFVTDLPSDLGKTFYVGDAMFTYSRTEMSDGETVAWHFTEVGGNRRVVLFND